MKYILFFVFFLSYSFANAQLTSSMKADMNYLTLLCNLSNTQQTKLESIFQKQIDDLETIERYKKGTDIYASKRRSIYKGTQMSIKLMMEENQMKGFKKFELKKRSQRSEVLQQLREEGATKEELRDAAIGIIE